MQEHVYVVKNTDSKDSRLLSLLFFHLRTYDWQYVLDTFKMNLIK